MFRLAALLFTLLLAAPANAGQWTVLGGEENDERCNFRFSGPINPGDLTAIRAHPSWNEAFRKRVCLDSPGGSLKEVYDFVITDGEPQSDFSTLIETGARCESACAILFMFGQSWGANSPFPDRMLQPGARLGFHSPFLEGAIAEDQRENAFRVALDVALLLMNRAYKAVTADGPPLPEELVSLVLSTPGDEMHYVDRVGEVDLLRIDRPYNPDIGLRIGASREALLPLVERICVSSYALTFPNWLVKDGYDFDDLVAWVNDTLAQGGFETHNLVELPGSDWQGSGIVGILSGPFYQPGWYSAGAALYCRVELRDVEKGPGYYGISNHFNVSFGPMFDLDQEPLPEENQLFKVIPAGLIPIDQRW